MIGWVDLLYEMTHVCYAHCPSCGLMHIDVGWNMTL